MSYRVVIKPAAEADLHEAMRWYDEQRAGLGMEFLLAVEDALGRVNESPLLFSSVEAGIRRIPTKRFPYALFYTIEGDIVFILGVFHGRRDPARWRERR